MEKYMLLSSFLSNLSCLSLQFRVWNHFLSSLLYAATRNKVEAMRLQPCLELLVVWHFVIPQGISRTHRTMQQSYRLVNTSEINHANTHWRETSKKRRNKEETNQAKNAHTHTHAKQPNQPTKNKNNEKQHRGRRTTKNETETKTHKYIIRTKKWVVDSTITTTTV